LDGIISAIESEEVPLAREAGLRSLVGYRSARSSGVERTARQERQNRRRESSCAHTDTKERAINRARQIIRNQGGGELRIKNDQGRPIDSDTIKPGREAPRRDTE
jgi:hypothetical protein